MSKPTARNPAAPARGSQDSVVRCAIVIGLILLGIAWMAIYINFAKDAALYVPSPGSKKPSDPLPWMADLKRWNYLIGFLLILAGLTAASHPKTPLGRGQGVVVGMLFCFLFGLIYILVYYFVGDHISDVPVMKDLGQFNLLVGVGFMAVGFTFATHWE